MKKTTATRKSRKRIKPILFSVVWLFLLLEIGAVVLSKTGIMNYSEPGYSIKNTSRFWVDTSKDFGVWHKPSSSYRHTSACYDVTYFSNSYGARDVERERNGRGDKVVVLGDSFVEGYGVELDDRLTDMLEKDTGVEFLNFGTAGNFGTTQQLLLYKTLAGKFSHLGVVIGMLPNNDFWDDDLEFGKRVYSRRYRPYLTGNYPNYKLEYYIRNMADSRPSLSSKMKSFLREFTYTYNMYTFVRETYLSDRYIKSEQGDVYSGYYDFKEEQLLKTRYALERIVSIARKKGKKVFLFTIPVYGDYVRFEQNGEKSPPLTKALRKISERAGFKYVDLLPPMYFHQRDWARYHHSCDRHWSRYGNEIAEKYLVKDICEYFSIACPTDAAHTPNR